MTLTVLGDAGMSFVFTLSADGLGRRNMLAVGAGLMIVSGIIFTVSGNYWILLLASILGVISLRYSSHIARQLALTMRIVEMRLAHSVP